MNAPMLIVILTGLLGTEVAAQSLPEIARRVRAERQGESTSRVYTNETIGQVRSVLSSSSSSIGREPSAPAEEGPTAENDARDRTEEEWRAMFEEARAAIARAEDRATLTEQELQELNRRLLLETSLYNRESILMPQIAEKQVELENAQQSVTAANEALAALTDELRQAGGPPGWAR